MIRPLMAVAPLPFVVAVIVVAVAGCGGDDVPCVGKVTDKFTTYDPGVNINVGGDGKGNGGVGMPVGNGTDYHLAIEREDGETCDRGVKKKVWLNTREGSTFPKPTE